MNFGKRGWGSGGRRENLLKEIYTKHYTLALSTNDMKNANRLLNIIKKAEAINKYNLILQSEMSISVYDKLKPFLLHIWPNSVSYNTKTKIWTWLKVVQAD